MFDVDGIRILIDPHFENEEEVREKYPKFFEPDYVILTHGHSDHTDALDTLSRDCAIIAPFELCELLKKDYPDFHYLSMNVGGEITLMPFIRVNMVKAEHSSSYKGQYAGPAVGYVLRYKTHSIYHAGDTSIFGDMYLIHGLYRPTLGLLPMDGIYTMDMDQVCFACRKYFDFKVMIPMHYSKNLPLRRLSDYLKNTTKVFKMQPMTDICLD